MDSLQIKLEKLGGQNYKYSLEKQQLDLSESIIWTIEVIVTTLIVIRLYSIFFDPEEE